MGIKEMPTSDFIKFLVSQGLVPVRTKGSHTSFNYPVGHSKKLPQPVVVRVNDPHYSPSSYSHQFAKPGDFEK